MSRNSETVFENFLRRYDETAWARALDSLLPDIHEVDRNATSIWFAFFPLSLARAFEQSVEPEKLAARLLMQGRYRLGEQIDTSHAFLYGHRFWPQVKRAVAERARQFTEETRPDETALARHIREAAREVATNMKVEESLVLGIAAVALMTLRQVGMEAFAASPGEVRLDGKHARQSPAKVLQERVRNDSQGLLGFLRTTDKRWTVVWDENNETARFKMMHRQEVASASPNDTRDWSKVDPRCTVGEGPIPVQCRSASCGTCWVGVLGGAEKLSPVEPRERRVVRQLGYADTDEPRPLIRLSCQAQGLGAVSIVIPPWNGVFGKYLREQREREKAADAVAQSSTA